MSKKIQFYAKVFTHMKTSIAKKDFFLKKTELPPIEAFYSKLSDETISQKDYNHAHQVWKEFNCNTIGDYHDLYLKTDVVLLADVFQTFRKTCMDAYNLTHFTITLHLDYLGMLCLNIHK